ncbi:MAG: lipase family protein [Planctomycetes bacterium]|nr:lipase family protein [Planctomycetota bacterium]
MTTDVQLRLRGPIERLDWLHQSLLFAQLSALAYREEPIAREAAQQYGFHDVRFLNKDGAQAYVLSTDHDRIVAFRGTEPREWNDIRADLNAVTDLAETVGRVHRGFKQEVDTLWPDVESLLTDESKAKWLTGHSLGGAMATICAGRCLAVPEIQLPAGLFTFGSPRVGNKQYVSAIALVHYRWVNNNDIVTRVPPTWLGYRHGGREVYLNRDGKVHDVTGWQRTLDRLRGFLGALGQLRIDQFQDHGIHRYIEYIREAVIESETVTGDLAVILTMPRRRQDAGTEPQRGAEPHVLMKPRRRSETSELRKAA